MEEVPAPQAQPGHVLIQTRASLISAGTERMLVEFGKAGWIEKARQQPEKVKQVLDKMWTDGLLPTIDAVRNKLDQPIPLGYSNVGKIVRERGSEIAREGDSEVAREGESSIDTLSDKIISIKKSPPADLTPSLPHCVIGLIGAGSHSLSTLLPALERTTAKPAMLADINPVAAAHARRRFGFEKSTTDVEEIFSNPSIDTVFITTRHNTHAQFVIKALKAGKHVFVEKPLCISSEELSEIVRVRDSEIQKMENNVPTSLPHSLPTSPILMIGYNRRFAPHTMKMKELLKPIKGRKSMIMTVNAGTIPAGHWTQDPDIGGGRIIGEACHFIDLLRFFAGSGIASSEIVRMDNKIGDTVTIQLGFRDGSIGTIHYFANGNRRFPKERLEIFAGQKVLQLDNFKTLKGYGFKGFRKMKLWRQDKGHRNEIKAFIDAVRDGKPSPIPFEEIVEVTKITLELSERARW